MSTFNIVSIQGR